MDCASGPYIPRKGRLFLFLSAGSYGMLVYIVMSGEIRYTSACGACGPAVQDKASCVGEFGDEWAYSDYGSCGDCQFNCVDFGLLGTACTNGAKAKCKHISYLGDKTSCCLGRGPGSNAKNSCNPTYNISNPECDQTYATYCSTGDRIITDSICKNWRNIRPQQSRQILQNYCTTHLDDPACRTWCKSIADGGDGACDAAVQEWCNSHPDDPYCTCIKSPLQNPKYGINPKCNDRKCIDTGYITANMRNTYCPDITNCDIQAQMANSGVQLTGVTINQNCGKNTPVPAPVMQGSVSSNSTSTQVPPTEIMGSILSDWLPGVSVLGTIIDMSPMYLFVFIFIILVLAAAIVAYFWGDNSSETGQLGE